MISVSDFLVSTDNQGTCAGTCPAADAPRHIDTPFDNFMAAALICLCVWYFVRQTWERQDERRRELAERLTGRARKDY